MMAPPRAHIVRSHSGPGTNTMIAMTNGAIWTSARTMWRSHHVRQVVSWSTHGARRAGSPPPKAYQSHCRGFGRRTGTSTSSLALFLGTPMVCETDPPAVPRDAGAVAGGPAVGRRPRAQAGA